MPEDNEGRYFMSDENIPRRYHYKVVDWVRAGEHPRRRKKIKESDLPFMDFAVLEVNVEGDNTDVSYVTVYGPADDWEFIEGVLAYDYGEEGSRMAPAA